jgi:hypothetical protein
MQRADEPGQRDQDVVPGGFGGEGLARDIARDEGQDFPALVVDAEWDGCGSEAGVPPELVSTLLAYARYVGEDGRGSYPATEVVAART